MRIILIYLLFLFISHCLISQTAKAQTISLAPLSHTTYCDRDTLQLIYSTTGQFKPDNYFVAQVSDTTGSFTSFVNIGHDSVHLGYIRIRPSGIGHGWRFRIISIDPYIVSDSSLPIVISGYPQTTAVAWRLIRPGPITSQVIGLVGDSIGFQSFYRDTTYKRVWNFGQDASIKQTTNNTPRVVYPTAGVKTA
jgi:hypothetical protein